MTRKELVAALMKFPEDAEVVLWDTPGCVIAAWFNDEIMISTMNNDYLVLENARYSVEQAKRSLERIKKNPKGTPDMVRGYKSNVEHFESLVADLEKYQ